MRRRVLCALLLLIAGLTGASAQIAEVMPVPQQQFLDANGNPINGGKFCTYAAGSLTPLATYSDSVAGWRRSCCAPARTRSSPSARA
jgi:hypothetical protein